MEPSTPSPLPFPSNFLATTLLQPFLTACFSPAPFYSFYTVLPSCLSLALSLSLSLSQPSLSSLYLSLCLHRAAFLAARAVSEWDSRLLAPGAPGRRAPPRPAPPVSQHKVFCLSA